MRFGRFSLSIPIQQFANQMVFLAVGKVVYRLSVTWVEIVAILLVGVALEHAFLFAAERKVPKFSPSAMSTGFNLAFMLGSTWFGVYVVGLLVGLGQKHVFKKLTGGHFQNPSNLAIVVALLVWPQYTYVTFLDWGQTWWFAGVIVALGGMLLWRIGLLYLPAVFLLAYSSFAWLFLTHNPGEIVRMILPAGFLLFSFFMVTEPKSLPSTTRFRALHAVATALFFVALQLRLGPKEVNLFLALVLAGMLVPLWRRWESRSPLALNPRFTAAVAFMVVFATVLYTSRWNLLRNSAESYQKLLVEVPDSTLAALLHPAQPLRPAPASQIDWGTQKPLDMFPADGTTLVSRPLVRQAAAAESRFVRRKDALPPYNLPVSARDVGNQFMPYAGVAVGDLNGDGAPDAVLARPLHPIMVLLNDGHGKFQDVTRGVFGLTVPQDVEQAVMGDFDNDGYLDLLFVYSRYRTSTPPTIFRFVATEQRFAKYAVLPSAGYNSGGVALYDVNHDSIPDIYISYGLNWLDPDVAYGQHGGQDTLLVSEKGGWVDRTAEFFGAELGKESFSGMTAVFADVTGDGAADFLLGNDFDHPSLTFFQTAGRFTLAAPGRLENNTVYSMSYLPIDVDGDGVYELWENGWSNVLAADRIAFGKSFTESVRAPLERDFDQLEKEAAIKRFNCAAKRDPIGISLCHDLTVRELVHLTHDRKDCSKILSDEIRTGCNRQDSEFNLYTSLPTPTDFKYNVEKYPKQLKENVLLRFDATTGKWKNVLKGVKAAEYTGFSWAAAAADYDNDGDTDLYLGNGAMQISHDANRLLLNESKDGAISFVENGPRWGADMEADARGIGAADFDGDGDVDLLVNNLLGEPVYLENVSGGHAIEIDLRNPGGDRLALGAEVTVQGKSVQEKRTVMVGGLWNTSQSTTLHFGTGEDPGPFTMIIKWRNGSLESHRGLRGDAHYWVRPAQK